MFWHIPGPPRGARPLAVQAVRGGGAGKGEKRRVVSNSNDNNNDNNNNNVIINNSSNNTNSNTTTTTTTTKTIIIDNREGDSQSSQKQMQTHNISGKFPVDMRSTPLKLHENYTPMDETDGTTIL